MFGRGRLFGGEHEGEFGRPPREMLGQFGEGGVGDRHRPVGGWGLQRPDPASTLR